MLNMNELVPGSILIITPYLSKRFVICYIQNINKLGITYRLSSWTRDLDVFLMLDRAEFIRHRTDAEQHSYQQYLPTYYEELNELLE